MKNKVGLKTYGSAEENMVNRQFVKHFKSCPIPDGQLFSNLGLFLTSKNLSRILFMNYLYTKIVDLQGIIIDFGTRWGQTLSLFAALRGIYEPFNRHRKIVGFDTFSGFPSISKKDGESDWIKKGNISVTENYVEYLTKIIEYQERLNPLSHIKKFEIVAGNAIIEIGNYLKRNPHSIVALAYFDLDLYEPTKKCLAVILPHLVKGSILVFDELNDPDCPGETIALKETLGLNKIKLKRYRYASRVSYFILE